MAFLLAGFSCSVSGLAKGDDLHVGNKKEANLERALQIEEHSMKSKMQEVIQHLYLEEDDSKLEAQIDELNSLKDQWKAVKLKLHLLRVEITRSSKVSKHDEVEEDSIFEDMDDDENFREFEEKKSRHSFWKHTPWSIPICRRILSETKAGRALVAVFICAILAALSVVATIKLITSTLTMFGFTSAGIAGGSLAAFVQAKIGTIVAGSWFASLQAAGMTGMVYTGPLGIFAGLGVAGGCVALYYYSNSGDYYDEFVTDLCVYADKHDSVSSLIKSFK